MTGWITSLGFWVLHTAWQHMEVVASLGMNQERYRLLRMRLLPEFSPEDRIAEVLRLFDRGFVFFENRADESVTPTEADLLAETGVRNHWEWNLWYGLTDLGFQVWEAVAKPDWDRYVKWESDNDDELFIASHAGRLDERFVAEFGAGASIRLLDIEVRVPWEIGDHKLLPCGVVYRWKPADNWVGVRTSFDERWSELGNHPAHCVRIPSRDEILEFDLDTPAPR